LSDKIESFTTFANIETSHPNGSIELYKSLIQPLKPFLNRSHLVVIPHRELHYIPFAAFSDGSNYLLDDYMITYLPSASSLPFIDENARDTGGTPLIMGNPTTGDYDITSSLATQRDQLGPLPFAEEETEVIAKLLGVDPYFQINATETLVKQRARSTSILHFAAHGLFNPTVPLNSLVALAPDKTNDGWLTVSEVYGLDLSNADLIVLSACETQIGQLTAGDEFVGLTRAFFFAGAPTVIASLWSVEDKSTALLMEQFYAHRLEGMGKGEALRQAQLDTRKQYPNPYYWAGFVLSGDAGNDHKLTSTPTEVVTTEPSNIPCASASLLLIIFMLYIQRK
jgi:CHAT domain-containing protein